MRLENKLRKVEIKNKEERDEGRKTKRKGKIMERKKRKGK